MECCTKHSVSRFFFRKTAVGLVCLLFFFLLLPVSALAQEPAQQADTRRTVRVAFPSQSGMSDVGTSGDLMGYNYIYLQELAQYAGWKLEYITFEDMSANDGIMSAMQMVMSGEADLLGPMLKSSAVEQMFDFPADNYGVVYTTLCALEKSNITSVNFTQMTPLRVAVYASAATRNQEVSDYLSQLGVEYELIPCETSDEQLEKLQNGEADLLSSITLSYFDGTRNVAEFAPRPYYFVTTKGNTALLMELDAATRALNYTRPYLQQQLQETFFGDTSGGYVLSDSEMEHLSQLKTLHVLCASSEDAPYVRKDSSGKPVGMLVSLLNDFAASNDLEIAYTFCDNPSGAEAEWQTGRYDCMIGIPLSSEYCSENDLIRTEEVTSVDLVLFAKQTTTKPLAESSVAIYKRLVDQVNLENFRTVMVCDTPADCYQAVENGMADYGCSDRLTTEYMLPERDSSLITMPLVGKKEAISIAVARSMGNEFLSALNKYIHTLPDSTKTTYLTEGSRHEIKSGLAVWVHDNPLKVAGIGSAVVILLASTIMFAFYASRIGKKNRQLEKANAAKSEFLARMSHDIRTPMNAIVGYLAIAKDTEGCPERVEHCIDNSDIAAKHLLQLINDVLDMSSIDSGKIKIASEEFDLKHTIADETTIFYQNSKAKDVHFESAVNGLTEEWVVGDPLRVNQIVMNLLSNAVKFTPKGGCVRFVTEQTGADENGTSIRFTVSDTGIGMSEEYLSRLFEPFEQESADTARQYGGSGLGLSIVHNLVTMMGGTITVESKQNEGTVFTVQLHFAKAKKHVSAQAPSAGEKLRALIVSADAAQGASMRDALESLGVRADVVESGAYAVKRVRRRLASDYPYKLCLLDWNTLGGEAAAAAAGIRAEAGEKRPMLLAAGYDVTEFEERAAAAGVDCCVKKPLFRSVLTDIVGDVLSGSAYAETARKKPAAVNMAGKHIILAEDNFFNQEIAVTVLTKAGIRVDTAENGRKAVELYEASPAGTYDFILMDVQMPVMDGYAATRVIRGEERTDAKTIPIIAMTANAFAEDVAEAMENGMNAHIAKPIDYEKLFAAVGELTSNG